MQRAIKPDRITVDDNAVRAMEATRRNMKRAATLRFLAYTLVGMLLGKTE